MALGAPAGFSNVVGSAGLLVGANSLLLVSLGILLAASMISLIIVLNVQVVRVMLSVRYRDL